MFEPLAMSLERWPDLKKLSLRGYNNITDKGVRHNKLEELHLSWCKNLSDAALSDIGTCPRLRTLDVAWCSKITGRQLYKIIQKGRLASLNIRNCTKIPLITARLLSSSGVIVFR